MLFITMTKPFPVNIKPRNEAKREFIMDCCEDPGYTLKDKKESKWDILHEKDDKPWTWDGLAPHYEAPATKKVYPPGA